MYLYHITSAGDDAQCVPLVIDVDGVIEHLCVAERCVFLVLSIGAQHRALGQVPTLRGVHHRPGR